MNFTIIPAFLALVLCQLLAVGILSVLPLPISSPVLGMALMVVVLARLGSVPEALHRCAAFLLRYLTLLFVPAGVGVMLYFERLRFEWLPLLLTLLLSTAMAMAATGLLLERLLGQQEKGGG